MFYIHALELKYLCRNINTCTRYMNEKNHIHIKKMLNINY